MSKFYVQSSNGFLVLMCLINFSQELPRKVHKTKYLVSIWVSSKTGMTFNVLQEISNQKYVMNLLKQNIYMCENIDIYCKRFQEMSIYSFSGQIKYEDFFYNQDIKRCQHTKKRRDTIFFINY